MDKPQERQLTSVELGAQQMDIKLGRKSSYSKKSIKDEVLLAFFIAVGNLPNREVEKYVSDVAKNMDLADRFNDVTCFYIPIRDGETRIERIYTGSKEFDKIQQLENEFSAMSINTDISSLYDHD